MALARFCAKGVAQLAREVFQVHLGKGLLLHQTLKHTAVTYLTVDHT